MSTAIVLDPTVIVQRAQGEAHRLLLVPSWTPAFDQASPDAPQLVRRLDRPDVYYYIVPFMTGNRVTARLRMNAYSGAYDEGIGIGKSGDELPPYRTRQQTYRRLETKFKKAAGPIVFEPFYAWKPCNQSFSALEPFYVVTVGGSVRYVRVDGHVFDALTVGAGN